MAIKSAGKAVRIECEQEQSGVRGCVQPVKLKTFCKTLICGR